MKVRLIPGFLDMEQLLFNSCFVATPTLFVTQLGSTSIFPCSVSFGEGFGIAGKYVIAPSMIRRPWYESEIPYEPSFQISGYGISISVWDHFSQLHQKATFRNPVIRLLHIPLLFAELFGAVPRLTSGEVHSNLSPKRVHKFVRCSTDLGQSIVHILQNRDMQLTSVIYHQSHQLFLPMSIGHRHIQKTL